MDTTIQAIKFGNNKTSVFYHETRKLDDEHDLNNSYKIESDLPLHSDFEDAKNNLKIHAAKILGLLGGESDLSIEKIEQDSAYWNMIQSSIEIKGVVFAGAGESKKIAIQIKAPTAIGKSIAMNIPAFGQSSEYPYTIEVFNLAETLEDEALAYIHDGKTSLPRTLNLFGPSSRVGMTANDLDSEQKSETETKSEDGSNSSLERPDFEASKNSEEYIDQSEKQPENETHGDARNPGWLRLDSSEELKRLKHNQLVKLGARIGVSGFGKTKDALIDAIVQQSEPETKIDISHMDLFPSAQA